MRARGWLFVVLMLSGLPAHADLPQRSGWPLKMTPGISGVYLLAPMEGVALVDLTGDKKLELVASSGDKVFAWDASGKALKGWPQQVLATAQAAPTVGDIDGDGDLEVVQVARGLKYSDPTYLHAFHHDGAVVKGWPKTLPSLVFHPVTLADLDGDGAQDMVVQLGKWPPAGSLVVLAGDGNVLGAGWNYLDLDGVPMAPAAVGDVTGDGDLELAVVTQKTLTVRRSDGTMLAKFPLSAPAGKRHRGGVLMLNLDAIAGSELVYGLTGAGSGKVTAQLQAVTKAGLTVTGFPATLASDAMGLAVPTAGDLDGDKLRELVANVRGKGLVVVDQAGQVKGKPIVTQADSTASVQLIDLDGDGKLELLADNNSADPKTNKGYLEAYELDGTPVTGFPLRVTGTTLVSSPSAADLDGDGKLELVVVSTVLSSKPESWVNVWTLAQGKVTPRAWSTYAHDERRSNCPACGAKSQSTFKADGAILDSGADAATPDAGAEAGADQAATPDYENGADGLKADRAAPECQDCNGCTCNLQPASRWQAGSALAPLLLLALVRRRRRRS